MRTLLSAVLITAAVALVALSTDALTPQLVGILIVAGAAAIIATLALLVVRRLRQ